MRKMVFGRKLSRGFGARQALLKSLARALVLYGAVKTTKAKAKATQKEIEKLIYLAKRGNISDRRKISSFLGKDRKLSQILFEKVVPAFYESTSGFTRIVNLPTRYGDNSQMIRLEWSQRISLSEQPKSKKGKKEEEKEAQSKNKVISKFKIAKFRKAKS